MKQCECGTALKEAMFNMGISTLTTKEKYAMPKNYQMDAWFCPQCGKVQFYARIPETDKQKGNQL